jgi:methylmalonyl-CoA mutase N-terminal domain/subunit
VLAYETDVTATVDPFAGSYVVEALTDEVERGALELMAHVEELGGAVAAIEQGFQKSEIERSAYDVALGIDSGERVVVGLNRYRSDSEERYEPLRVDPAIEADQRERLRSCASARRRRRDGRSPTSSGGAGDGQRAAPPAHRAEGAGHRRRGLRRARGVGYLLPQEFF